MPRIAERAGWYKLQKGDWLMKVFLAGATGVIGRNLIPRLAGAGHEVVGMTGDVSKSGLVRSLGAAPVVVDVFDRDGLQAAVRAASPDAMIDQLTSLHGGDYAATNRVRTEGTRNLIDAAEVAATPVMVAQSYCVYAPGTGLADESDPLDVNSPVFGAAAEALVTLEGMVSGMPHGVLLRYGTLYGPGTAYAEDGPVADQVRRGELPASEDVTSFLHVDDAAEAALQALGWAAGTVNIVDDVPAAATDWLPAYAAAIGAPPPPGKPATGGPLRGAANSKARTEFGWEPIHPSWQDGFQTALG
jgi:nucleoside-diphosphate-sugar epimerase